MEAHFSGLQKIFCQLSESVNVNKKPYTGVSSSDSKLTHPKRSLPTSDKKRSPRRNSLSKLLTHDARAQNQRYIKIFQAKLFQTKRLNFFLEALDLYRPSSSSLEQILLNDSDNFAGKFA